MIALSAPLTALSSQRNVGSPLPHTYADVRSTGHTTRKEPEPGGKAALTVQHRSGFNKSNRNNIAALSTHAAFSTEADTPLLTAKPDGGSTSQEYPDQPKRPAKKPTQNNSKQYGGTFLCLLAAHSRASFCLPAPQPFPF